MILKSRLKHIYDNSFVYRLCVALIIGGMVFHALGATFEWAFNVGPSVGGYIYDLTHKDELGQMVFSKD